ncbi:MAG: hypothetical protein P8Z42_13995, partial [Anaerolineales bacterium]
ISTVQTADSLQPDLIEIRLDSLKNHDCQKSKSLNESLRQPIIGSNKNNTWAPIYVRERNASRNPAAANPKPKCRSQFAARSEALRSSFTYAQYSISRARRKHWPFIAP